MTSTFLKLDPPIQPLRNDFNINLDLMRKYDNLRLTQSVWIRFNMTNYVNPNYDVVITFCYYCHDFQIAKNAIIPSSMAAFHVYDIDIG